jgi:hypothetical protein
MGLIQDITQVPFKLHPLIYCELALTTSVPQEQCYAPEPPRALRARSF